MKPEHFSKCRIRVVADPDNDAGLGEYFPVGTKLYFTRRQLLSFTAEYLRFYEGDLTIDGGGENKFVLEGFNGSEWVTITTIEPEPGNDPNADDD